MINGKYAVPCNKFNFNHEWLKHGLKRDHFWNIEAPAKSPTAVHCFEDLSSGICKKCSNFENCARMQSGFGWLHISLSHQSALLQILKCSNEIHQTRSYLFVLLYTLMTPEKNQQNQFTICSPSPILIICIYKEKHLQLPSLNKPYFWFWSILFI